MHMIESIEHPTLGVPREVAKNQASRPSESAENDRRMELCPSFSDCEAPKCPLDAMIDLRVVRPGDKKCVAHRITRLALGQFLPRKGLTKREFEGIIRWYGTWSEFVKAKGLKYDLTPEGS